MTALAKPHHQCALLPLENPSFVVTQALTKGMYGGQTDQTHFLFYIAKTRTDARDNCHRPSS